MSTFEFAADTRAEAFCLQIVDEMRRHFGTSTSEAIGRINQAWSGSTIEGDDIIYHEEPQYWAYTIYFGKDSSWWLNPPELKPLPYP